MAYVPLSTVTASTPILASWGNQVKDNFAAGVPDIFTTKGDIAAASGNDAAARLAVGTNYQLLESLSTATLGVAWGSGVLAVATSGTQSIPDNTNTKVQINTVSIDSYSFLDAVNYRLTVPVGFPSRYYIVVAYGEFAAHATAGKQREVQIYKNGGGVMVQATNQEVSGTLSTRIAAVSFPILLDATNYVEMWCFHQAGANLNIGNNSLGLFMIR